MKNKILFSSFLLSLSGTILFCNNSVKSSGDRTFIQDTVKRPAGVSSQATLINLGFDDAAVFIWVEYSGKLKLSDQTYPHIYGFRYFDARGKLLHTRYYENMEIRNGTKEFEVKDPYISPFPGDATIRVSNGTESLLFFHVLESNEFKRTYKGIEYVRMPAVSFETRNENGFMADEDVEFNIKRDQDRYIVAFTRGGVFEVAFKLCSSCRGEPGKISFLDEHAGRIYFVQRECYLEPTNVEDIKRIQALKERY